MKELKYSKKLHHYFSRDTETGECIFDDGTRYTGEEVNIISREELDINQIKNIHLLKHVFCGVLEVKDERD